MLQRDVETMPIAYEMRLNRPIRAERTHAWCSRRLRAIKRSFRTKAVFAILLMGIPATIIFYIVSLTRAHNLPYSEAQVPKVEGSSRLGSALKMLKQKLETAEQWAALRADSGRETRQKRAVKEIDYSWPAVVTLFLVGVVILLAVVVALATWWLVRELRQEHRKKFLRHLYFDCCAYIKKVRNDGRGGYQDLEGQGDNHASEEQVDGSPDALGTAITNWREGIYTREQDAEFSVLKYDQFQPERGTISSTEYSRTESPSDLQQVDNHSEPLHLEAPNNSEPLDYPAASSTEYSPIPSSVQEIPRNSKAQRCRTSIKHLVVGFIRPLISSPYSAEHGEQSTSEAIAPIQPLPNARREQSQSMESSSSGTVDSVTRLLEDTRIPGHGMRRDLSSGGYGSADCTRLTRETINRAAPGVIVFKNLSGDDFSDDRVLEMEEGRIFWHC